MSSIQVADAYVALTTKMPGVKKEIEDAIDGADSQGAGEKLATGVGAGISNKQAAIAGAVGGIFASVANQAAGALADLIGDAVAQSDATDKFAQTLDFAGLDTSAVDAAIAKSQSYADRTVYDLSTIQNTTAQLAANGIQNYSELTEAAGNLNAVSGGNAETFKSVATMLSQTAGAGKLTTENWNQLADAIPGASGRLQDALSNAGAYTGNFRDAMAEGQITADEFNAAILELGSEPVAQEAATSVSTMEGAVGNLSAAITGQLAAAFTALKPIITPIISAFAWFISNTELLVPILSGLAVALLVLLAPAIWAAVVATAAWTVALLANPITWIVLAIIALVAAIVWLVMHWDEAVAWITEVWGGFMSWIGEVINSFVTWWNGIWTAVGQWISDVWNGIVSAVQNWWASLWGFIVAAVAGFANWWSGVWDGIVGAWEAIWRGIGDFFRGIWDGIVSGIRGYVNMIVGIINGIIDGINAVGGVIGDAIGVNLRIPRIPGLAHGGTVTRGGSVIVGENGPELLTLPAGASVNPDIRGGMPSTMVLRVGEREFTAYVDERADGRITSYDQSTTRGTRGRAQTI